MSSISFDEFRNRLPEDVRNDIQRLLNVCRAANIDVPLEERFYTKRHTPKVSDFNPDPSEAEFVVVPSTRGKHNLWIRKEHYKDFANAVIAYGRREGLLE